MPRPLHRSPSFPIIIRIIPANIAIIITIIIIIIIILVIILAIIIIIITIITIITITTIITIIILAFRYTGVHPPLKLVSKMQIQFV